MKVLQSCISASKNLLLSKKGHTSQCRKSVILTLDHRIHLIAQTKSTYLFPTDNELLDFRHRFRKSRKFQVVMITGPADDRKIHVFVEEGFIAGRCISRSRARRGRPPCSRPRLIFPRGGQLFKGGSRNPKAKRDETKEQTNVGKEHEGRRQNEEFSDWHRTEPRERQVEQEKKRGKREIGSAGEGQESSRRRERRERKKKEQAPPPAGLDETHACDPIPMAFHGSMPVLLSSRFPISFSVPSSIFLPISLELFHIRLPSLRELFLDDDSTKRSQPTRADRKIEGWTALSNPLSSARHRFSPGPFSFFLSLIPFFENAKIVGA